jgi:photosystem II stability/assembly factor-like uncharacterized protein
MIMKKIIYHFFLVLTFLLSGNASAQWFQQQSGTNFDLRAVYFVDSLNGYIAGNNWLDTSIFLFTTNGGTNWTQRYIFTDDTSNLGIYSMQFLNYNTGYIATSYNNNGAYYKTTNAGLNWNLTIVNSVIYIEQIYFVSQDTGYIVLPPASFPNSSIYKTTNGGLNWNFNYSISSGYEFKKICFVNFNTGYLVGSYPSGIFNCGGIICKTTNNGNNWSIIFQSTAGFPNSAFRSISFFNTSNGLVIGGSGSFKNSYRSTNSGSNWIIGTNSHEMYDCWILNNQYCYAVGSGGIEKSTNGGLKWFQDISSSFCNNIFFVNNRIGWVVGNQGFIYKTTNGSATFTNNFSSEIPEKFSLSQNYPNPFNPSTNIRYQIKKLSSPHALGGDLVKLKIFDILGKEIETLVNEKQSSGTYEVTWNGSNYPSGVYFYKLTAGEFTETKKMVMIK